MIVVLSLNTAVDRLMLVQGFAVGGVFRAERSMAFAGGKALNVARVLRQLGHSVRVVGTLGGMPEDLVRSWCDREGVDGRWIRVEADSRTCVIVIDPRSAHQTVLNEPGPYLSTDVTRQIETAVDGGTQEGDTLCISGSTPPGVPASFYAELVHRLQGRGVKVLVDASGEALRLVLEEHPWAVAPNASECATALSQSEDPRSLIAALSKRVDHAMVTMGADGLLYAHGGNAWHVHSPAVHTVSAVGSGDACVAGFLGGIHRGLPSLDALRLGVACGAANAARFEPGIGSTAEVERLSGLVRIDPLAPHQPEWGSDRH